MSLSLSDFNTKGLEIWSWDERNGFLPVPSVARTPLRTAGMEYWTSIYAGGPIRWLVTAFTTTQTTTAKAKVKVPQEKTTTSKGRVKNVSSWMVSTFVGTVGGYGGTDATGAAASFDGISGICTVPNGDIYVVCSYAHTIRKVTPAGVVTTVAGLNGTSGSSDGTGSAARFYYPFGICYNPTDGNLYVGDTKAVRCVTLAGVVTTLAGGVTFGYADGTGAAAQFKYVYGIAADLDGNLYAFDNGNDVIRKITLAGVVTTFAGAVGLAWVTDGTGTGARIGHVRAMTRGIDGNIYFVELYEPCVRQMTIPGAVVTKVAGNGSGGYVDANGTSARFYGLQGMTTMPDGSFIVSDTTGRTIRKVTTSYDVTTLAGTNGVSGDTEGRIDGALFTAPTSVVGDSGGKIYIAQNVYHSNNVIRLIDPVGTLLAKAAIIGTYAATVQAKAKIKFLQAATTTAKARLKFLQAATTTAKANIAIGLVLVTVQAKARITQLEAATAQAKARLKFLQAATTTAKARVKHTGGTTTLDAKARILSLGIATSQAKARVKQLEAATATAKAFIINAGVVSVTAKARVKQLEAATAQAKARVKHLAQAATVQGKARVTFMRTNTVTARANLRITRVVTALAKAKVINLSVKTITARAFVLPPGTGILRPTSGWTHAEITATPL